MVSHQIPVEAWLQALGLREYLPNFKQYSGVEDMLYLSESAVQDLGVKNGAHRARIVSSLDILREKLKMAPGAGRTVRPVRPILHTSPLQNPRLPANLLFGTGEYAIVQATYQPLRPFSPNTLKPPQLTQPPNDGQDLYKYVWYHSTISRQTAESLVACSGDFLVRDSSSQPGDYVLTCNWNNSRLHFVINKQHVMDEVTGETKIQYQFEENLFDRIAELIHHYVSEKKAISEMSGAIISNPVSRIAGFDAFDVIKQGGYGYSPSRGFLVVPGSHSTGHTPRVSPRPSPLVSPTNSPPNGRKGLHRRTGSQPLLSINEEKNVPRTPTRSNTSPGSPLSPPSFNNQTTKSNQSHVQFPLYPKKSASNGDGPIPSLPNKYGPKSPVTLVDSAPPKPSRIPTIKRKERPMIRVRNKALYEDDGKDYSDYDQVKAWTESSKTNVKKYEESNFQHPNYDNPDDYHAGTGTPSVIILNRTSVIEEEGDYDNNFRNAGIVHEYSDYDIPKPVDTKVVKKGKRQAMFSETTKENFNYDTEMLSNHYSPPQMTLPKNDGISYFDLQTFTSNLLPLDNKPLEGSVLVTIKSFLLERNPRILAQHLTAVDLETLKVTGHNDLGAFVTSGLELVTLPQGHQLRKDILERFECIKLFVAVTILTCVKYPERARMMSQWIQIAGELRASTGNLFGFTCVMEALQMGQIARLKNSWLSLKHQHGNSSLLYETKLSGSFRDMQQGGSTLPLQNVTVPNILPLIHLLERTEPDQHSPLSWENSCSDYGIDIMLAHLDTARLVTEQCGLYRVTGEALLRKFDFIQDMKDMFCTELHLKLLWGYRGATANQNERYKKYGELLNVLSDRAEPALAGPDQETSV